MLLMPQSMPSTIADQRFNRLLTVVELQNVAYCYVTCLDFTADTVADQ